MRLTAEQAELRFKAIQNLEKIRDKTDPENTRRLWFIEKCLQLLKRPFFEEEQRAESEIMSADVRQTSYSERASPAPNSIQSAYEKPLLAEIALETGELSPRLNRKDSPRSGEWVAKEMPEGVAPNKNNFRDRIDKHTRSFSEGNARM